jgi:hypothetical protein
MYRISVFAVSTLIGGVLVAILLSVSNPTRDSVTPAERADAFVESIGINVHLGYTNTSYSNYPLIKDKLVKLDIRHARDGTYSRETPDRREAVYDKYRDLAASGIKFDLVHDSPIDRYDADGRTLSEIAKLAGDSLEAVEGPNEPDIQEDRSVDWASMTRASQASLYKAVRSNPNMDNISVIGTSIAHGDNVRYVMDPNGDGEKEDLGAYLDYGNIHSYSWALHPFAAETRLVSWHIPQARLLAGGKRLIATETGYTNATNDQSVGGPVTEGVAAKYTTRNLLEHFKRGFVRTYVYEFIDEFPDPGKVDRESNWGLLRYDGSEKPAYAALKNLIDLLEDPGPPFEPQGLDFSLSGDTSNVHRLLLQKRDGQFYLILWLEVSSYDRDRDEEIHVPSQRVTLHLDTPISEATVYQPTFSTDPVTMYSALDKIHLGVPDHPVVVELQPL